MSHVVSVQVTYKDLEMLKKAISNCKWTFLENQKTYKWFGSWVNDYHGEDAAYKMGIKPEDYGKCEHAIKVPGCNYEVGIIEKEGEYQLIWDAWDGNLAKKMEESNLAQEYAKEAIKEKLKNSELDVWQLTEEKDKEGNLYLNIEVGE